MLDLNQLINTAIANSIELAVRDQLTPYIKRIEELETLMVQRQCILNEVEQRVHELDKTSTQIDPDTLAEAVSNALDDKMDAICERVAEDIDLHGNMRDFIKNEVTISLDTY